MMEIAESNGLLVSVIEGEIYFYKIQLNFLRPRTHVIDFLTKEIHSLEMEANVSGQYAAVSSRGWDISKQEMTATALTAEQNKLKVNPGNLSGQSLAPGLGNQNLTLSSPAPLSKAELESWSYATLARSRLGLIRGRISIKGTTDIKLMDTIKINRVGKRFGASDPANQDNSKALVTGVRHRVTEQLGWVTDIQFGLSDEWLSSRPDVASPSAAGLIPPISGLQIGIVDDYDADPDNQYRVKVKIPAFQQPVAEGQPQPPYSVWARLASLDAGDKRGVYVRPEPRDEVVLGFFNEDPRQPVIIGSLYSKDKHPIPAIIGEPNKDNSKKGWVTKSGLSISFDDDQKEILLATQNKNTISLNDTTKEIKIQDQYENCITMNEKGISVKSNSNLTIEAKENITYKAKKINTIE
ncbi:MAG: phage baseplate assembly protein V [Candidatus Methylumidiphilus sp.]